MDDLKLFAKLGDQLDSLEQTASFQWRYRDAIRIR